MHTKKIFRLWSVLLAAVTLAMLLAACGDTATSAPTAGPTAGAATTTTAAMTTTSAATTTTAAMTSAAATTSAAAATTAAGATTTSAAAGSGSGNGQTIRIYSSLPDTGSSKTQTDTLINAMKLALSEVNGTVNGYKIDYVALDDATAAAGQWDAGQEAANANKAVNDPAAMVYIGTFNSGAAKVSIPILNKAGLAMISPANTYPGLTKAVQGVTDTGEPDKYYPTGTRNYFRIIPDDDLQGPADASFMAKTLNVKNLYIIDDSQAYGVGLAKAVEDSASKDGMKVIKHDSITGKESDYKSLANTIKSAGPDGIFFGGISQQQAGKLLSDIRAAGVQVPFVGGDGINDDAFLKDSGSAGEGAYSSVGGADVSALPAKGQAFVTNYKAKYGDTIQAYTIYGYEAMGVALDAIKRAGTADRKAVLQAVAATQNYQGALGTWSFDKNGDTTLSTFSFYQDKGGKWTFSTSVNATAS